MYYRLHEEQWAGPCHAAKRKRACAPLADIGDDNVADNGDNVPPIPNGYGAIGVLVPLHCRLDGGGPIAMQPPRLSLIYSLWLAYLDVGFESGKPGVPRGDPSRGLIPAVRNVSGANLQWTRTSGHRRDDGHRRPPNVFIGLTVGTFVLFVLLRDGEQFTTWLRAVGPVSENIYQELIAELDNLMWASGAGRIGHRLNMCLTGPEPEVWAEIGIVGLNVRDISSELIHRPSAC